MNKTKQLFAGLILMATGQGSAQAEYALNLVQGVTKVSHDIYDLHMLILWICVLIGIGVFGTMFYSIYHHRKDKGHKAEQFHENTTIEIIWTIIPTLILISMAIPATKTMLELDDVQDSDLSIKVTGWQWKWEYEYLDDGIHFFSNLDEASNKARQVGSGIDPRTVPNYLLNVDNPLVIPTNKKIRFVFTAADVIHSWWVPDLGWKKDANPGFINEAWTLVEKPGTYRGQCTELCGKDHGFMPIVVIAKEQADYEAWVKETQEKLNKGPDLSDQSREDLVAKGAAVYEKNCATCHLPGGEGVPGAFPALKGSAVVKGDINVQSDIVINGKNAMPAFGKMLKADQIAEVITYTRNALGNKVGDEIQPSEILKLLPSDATGSAAVNTESRPAVASSGGIRSKEELVAQGRSVYENNCASCHQSNGQGMPPTFPALSGSSLVTGDIQAQVNLMLNGKGMMPSFKSLSADDFAAVVTYTRNELGNSVNDSIQPSEIAALQ